MVKEIVCNNCLRSVYFNENDINKGIVLYCPFCHAAMTIEDDVEVEEFIEDSYEFLEELIADIKANPDKYVIPFIGAYKPSVIRNGLRKQMSYDEYVWPELENRLRTNETYRELHKKFKRLFCMSLDFSSYAESFADAMIYAFIVEIGKKHIGYTTVFDPFADMNDYTLIVDGFSCIRHLAVDFFIKMLEGMSSKSDVLTHVLENQVSDANIIKEYILKYYDDIPAKGSGKKDFMKLLNTLEMRPSPASYMRDMTGGVAIDKSKRKLINYV